MDIRTVRRLIDDLFVHQRALAQRAALCGSAETFNGPALKINTQIVSIREGAGVVSRQPFTRPAN